MKSVWYGSFLLMVYDSLRILRRVIPHSSGVIAVEDLIFWMGSGLFLFSGFFRENSGVLRAYLFAGVAAGIGAWHFSFSRYFVEGISAMLIKIKRILRIPVQKILILVKRLKFWLGRCKISLYTRKKAVCDNWKQKAKTDRGAEHGKKENRRKKKKHKSEAHECAE